MQHINRRTFLKSTGIALTALAMPPTLRAAAAPHVVVVGGGFGGATVAKYLRLWGGHVQVTLVEPNAQHSACILSNLVVTGALSMGRITLNYNALKNGRGVNVLQGRDGARSGRQSTDCHHSWWQSHAAIRSSGAGTGRRFFTAARR